MAELPINEDVKLLWAPVVPGAPRSDQARLWQMTQYCQIVTPEISSVSIIISIWVIWSLNIYRFTNSKCDFSSYRNWVTFHETDFSFSAFIFQSTVWDKTWNPDYVKSNVKEKIFSQNLKLWLNVDGPPNIHCLIWIL